MTQNKTPLQKLIEDFRAKPIRITKSDAIAMCQKYLPEEREIIEKAYDDGDGAGADQVFKLQSGKYDTETVVGEDYFNKNFHQ